MDSIRYFFNNKNDSIEILCMPKYDYFEWITLKYEVYKN